MDEKDLIGKTIEEIDLDGFGIKITFTDGTILTYVSSDDGFSLWDIVGNEKNVPTIDGWISTNDRMPEKDKDVLVWLYGDYYIGRYNQDPDNLQMRWLFEGFNLYEDNMSYITYWMPLPKPPEEKK